jgi:hypothetical protein
MVNANDNPHDSGSELENALGYEVPYHHTSWSLADEFEAAKINHNFEDYPLGTPRVIQKTATTRFLLLVVLMLMAMSTSNRSPYFAVDVCLTIASTFRFGSECILCA